MGTNGISVQEIQATLERELAFHREREAFHREHHAFHAGEAERAERELAGLRGALDRFSRRATASAGPGNRPAAPPPAPRPGTGPAAPVRKITLAKAVWAVLLDLPAGDEFGAIDLTPVVEARFRAELGTRPDPSRVGAVLRRFLAERSIEVAREGRPHHPGTYRMRAADPGE